MFLSFVTTSPTINVVLLKTIYPGVKVVEVVRRWITGDSSMPFSKYCAPAHPRTTYRLITVAGIQGPLSFIRWRNKSIWTKQMPILSGEKDMEWLMMDATHI